MRLRARQHHIQRKVRPGQNTTSPGPDVGVLSPQATQALISRFLATPEPRSNLAQHDILAGLTAREQETMALAAQGYSNDDIAAKLFLSTHTVRTHIQRAMMKLHARDRAQLVVIAYQTGLVRPAPPPP